MDVTTGKQLAAFKGKANFDVHSGASPDGRYLFQMPDHYSNDPGDQDEGYLWDLNKGEKLLTLGYHRTEKAVSNRSGNQMSAWSPDGRGLLVVCPDGAARLWDVPSGKLRLTLQDPSGGIWYAGFSRDSRRIVTAPWNEEEILRHIFGEDLREKVWNEGGLHWHATTRGRVWDAETGREIAVLGGQMRDVMAPVLERGWPPLC